MARPAWSSSVNKRTHKQKVFDLLRDGRWHGHMEGYRLGVMLHSRVADLRKDGHMIECKRGPEGYLYRLLDSEAALPENVPLGVASESSSLSSLRDSALALNDGDQSSEDGGLLHVHPEQLELIA